MSKYSTQFRQQIESFSKEQPHTLRAKIEELARVTKTQGTVMVGFAFSWLPVCIIDYVDAEYGAPTLP